MNKTYLQKASAVSLHRQRFIIPPTETLKSHSQHIKTCATTSSSFKRKIQMSSMNHKSWSHQKFPQHIEETSNKLTRDSDQFHSTDETFHPMKSTSPKVNKFQPLKRKTFYDADWAKWKKNHIDYAGKRFALNLNAKIQKRILPSDQRDKQHSEIFRLKHQFRQLSQLKKTVEKTQHNNYLIHRLKEQSNQKIIQFFGKYEKLIQQSIK